MARPGRLAFRLLLAGALAGSLYVVWVTTVETPSPIDLLPQGAAAVVELRDAEAASRRLAGTQIAAAFARSETRAWLERTAIVKSFDSLRVEVGRATGWLPDRSAALDLLGAEAATAWYHPNGNAANHQPWIAAGRLSVRAWAAATGMCAAWSLGIGATPPQRETVSGITVYSFPGEDGQSLHLLLAGRVLVAGSDRDLILKAAGTAADEGTALIREPAWQTIRGALPSGGGILFWVRGPGSVPGVPIPGAGLDLGDLSAGVLVRAGESIQIDFAVDSSALRAHEAPASAEPAVLPALALLRPPPLFFLSGNDPFPGLFTDLLRMRQREAAARGSGPAVAIHPGRGFALAITGSSGETGLFPTPQGIIVLEMQSAAAAAAVLPSLFPPGARKGVAGGAQALATRESLPLSGGFDFWGAAIGSRLVFATDTSLIDRAAADAGTTTPADLAGATPDWRVRAIAALSVEQALPLLRRWAIPLSGLLAANYPSAPDLVRDIELLAALRSIHVSVGSDGRRGRASITLTLAGR